MGRPHRHDVDPVETYAAPWLASERSRSLHHLLHAGLLSHEPLLGISVHEVLQQPEAYDKTLECLSLLRGETKVQRLEAVLNKIDLNQDRNISADELQNALSDKEFGESLGVEPRVLVALHSNLDTEGTGTPSVGLIEEAKSGRSISVVF